MVWTLSALFVLLVFPGLVGATAAAQSGTSGANSGIDGLSWMNVSDSYGVPVANYQFVTDHGGIFDPGAAWLWMLLGLELVGYLIIAITAIWLLGYALSFQWLSLFSGALHGIGRNFTETVATPAALVTAATLGAFCVAWFVLRGYHAKAVMQIITMLVVAVIGPMFLADPLAEVLSPDGLLGQGRDVGISVAAGLNGDANPDPAHLISSLQGVLADNLIREPLQVWNFGHAVDGSPACRAAWSTGVLTSDTTMRNGLQACGDAPAVGRSKTPTTGQVATGLMLLICSALLLLFAVFLAVRVIKAALDAIFHGFSTILGFAAGGFIYGPTQTFLVRSVVHGIVSAARMTLYVIFLSFYTTFLGNIFQQAQGHVMAAMVTAGIVEVIAFSQMKKLSRGISKSNDWIANRFAVAVQNGMSKTAIGGGGTALGMGAAHAGGGKGAALMTRLAILNTLNANPAVAWAAAATNMPGSPQSRRKKKADLANMKGAPMGLESNVWNQAARDSARIKAGIRAGNDFSRGPKTFRQLTNILDGLPDAGVPESMHIATLLMAGATHEQAIHLTRAKAAQGAHKQDVVGIPAVQKAVAATYSVMNHVEPTDAPAVAEVMAEKALMAVQNLKRVTPSPTDPNAVNHVFVQRIKDMSETELEGITKEEWDAENRDTRWQVATNLTTELNEATQAYADAVAADPTRAHAPDMDIMRTRMAVAARRIQAISRTDPISQGRDPFQS
ncbi:hypothetical protein ACFXG7_35965 [Nocardia tengchongensis]